MNRKNNNTASQAVLVCVMIGLAPMLMVQNNAAADKASGSPPEKAKRKQMVLINVDEESVGYIRQAKKFVEQKDYADAIDILQTLLDRPEHRFVPTEEPRRFVSLATRINGTIGQLPPKGMKLYRRLYDIKAGRMFRAAAERFDELALRILIRRYFHTSYGDDALNLLGGILFDRGEFAQAARCWKKVLSSFGSKDEPMLLAKIAVAHHFAGEPVRAVEAMKLLTGKYPQARATISGKEQNVTAFTRRMLTLLPPQPVGPRARRGWPSLAGAPDSMAVMGPCKPALSVRWTVPGGKLADNPNIKAALAAAPYVPKSMVGKMVGALREGQVTYTGRLRKKSWRTLIPALIHPIVVGETVIYRAAEGVAAHDLLTGEKLWQTLSFGLYRQNRIYLGGPSPLIMEDQAFWTLTAGDGKVFAVGRFIPGSKSYYYAIMDRGLNRNRDTSVLAAFSIANQGRMLWKVGEGKGDSDLIRGGRFLTAPTYVAGRLYVLVEDIRAHHLVCLNAENGRLLWDTKVAQLPMQRAGYGRHLNPRRDRTSPPAVSDGKVFVVTNTGVAAAFEAATGRSLWAYQYDSKTCPSSPANPVVVTTGRAICLPADSERLLAFRTDTGKLEWSADRRGQRDLTAVDHSRLLLSGRQARRSLGEGGGLRIIDAATGKDVWTGGKIAGIHGRPAVTTDAILASGKGEIIRVSLKDFSVTRLPVKQPDAILGNLISVGGKLIAANAAGVSVYFPKSK